MNPPFPIPLLVSLAVVVLALAAAGAWRGSSGIPGGLRSLLLALRLAAVAAVILLLFNPGKWIRPGEERVSPWIVLRDVSASMARPVENGGTRADAADGLVRMASAHAKSADIPLRVHPFSSKLEAPTDVSPDASGSESRILPAASQVLEDAAASGDALAGIIVLSDGRQTPESTQAALDALGLRARSRNVAIHTVAIGAGSPPPDLAIIQPRVSLTAFAGQPLRIPFALKSAGLSPERPVVILSDETGKELASLTLELATGATVQAAFSVTAPSASAQWTIATPVIDGEVRSSNNSVALNIRILASKTRVFLVEGAPYWDSKFLALLLRQQPHMDVRSIHRLSDQRYFRIDSGGGRNEETTHPVFPSTLEELATFDLIVFGKNIDPFLTPERAEMLRAYVRDHGGAVLFARGKPATSRLESLEPLEPVVWGAATTSEFRFAPGSDGEAAGLFGQALPAPDSSLWTSLPALKDGRAVALVKPFTRVLAEGVPATGSAAVSSSGRFPALLVRRYGQGVTGLVNGDGLWKWDFFPEARELGNCYEDFWTQLIQWMASYSEFLPGQDFSLRLPASRGEAGATIAATISYRGSTPAPQPLIAVTGADGISNKTTPAAISDPSGRPLWRASFTPDRAGLWSLKLVDPRADAPPTPEVLFTVPTPARETDDFSPDADFLEALARATGGETPQPEAFPEFLKSRLVRNPPVTRESGAVWQPSWNSTFVALVIAALFAAEWFIRRRQGLT